MRVTFFWRAQHQRIYFECVIGLYRVCSPRSLSFSMSIRDNIRFAVPQAPQEAVEAAADLASINDDIKALPEGYETMVGERGSHYLAGRNSGCPSHGH